MLIAAAAAQWGVPEAECAVERGEVVHAGAQRRLGIGALVGAASALPLAASPSLRPKSELRYTGRKVPRVDLAAKVRGEPVFASDVERPGMVYACARLSPVFGADTEGFDRGSAVAVPGVLDVVPIPGGAAVVANSTWAAIRGAEALQIRFKATPHERLDSATISRQMRAGLAAAKNRAIELRVHRLTCFVGNNTTLSHYVNTFHRQIPFFLLLDSIFRSNWSH